MCFEGRVWMLLALWLILFPPDISAATSAPLSDCHLASFGSVTLDTPMNRKFMPDADFGSWTPLEFIAEMFFAWASGENRPASGSLMQLQTSGGETQAVAAQ